MADINECAQNWIIPSLLCTMQLELLIAMCNKLAKSYHHQGLLTQLMKHNINAAYKMTSNSF